MLEIVIGGSALVAIGGLSTRSLARARGDERVAAWAWRITLFWLLALSGCLGLVAIASLRANQGRPPVGDGTAELFITIFATLLIPILTPVAVGAAICSAWLHLTNPASAPGDGPGLIPSRRI